MKHNVEPNMGANSEVLEFHDGITSTKLYKEFLWNPHPGRNRYMEGQTIWD